MFYYSKITAQNPKENAYRIFLKFGANDDSIILDESYAPKQTGSIYLNLKERLLQEHNQLTIDSLRSLGKNNREISRELSWFAQNKVSLVVLDLPTTHSGDIAAVSLLAELYSQLANVEIQNVKEKQIAGIQKAQVNHKPLGRKRIPYPENWAQLYPKWQNKEISATEFMQLTGLKKGTLYNLIKQYKGEEALQKQA